MNIAICDDDLKDIEILIDYLKKIDDGMEIKKYSDGKGLLRDYERGMKYDVIFLDMEMKELNGIETANSVRELDEDVVIIFVSNHEKYAIECFQSAPFRFLLKPLDFEKLKKAYNDMLNKLSKRNRYILINENKVSYQFLCSEIIYCESKNHSVNIFTKSGRVYRIRKSLGDFYNELDKNLFCRVHFSYLVNFLHVKSVSKSSMVLRENDEIIPISRSYAKSVSGAYMKFIERNMNL